MSAVICGELYDWFETGTEGVVWVLQEEGKEKEGYDGMHFIEEGDRLKIFGEDGGVLFDDVIREDRKAGWHEYPRNPGHGQPSALGLWIHWTQQGWEPDAWASLFVREEGKRLHGELIKKAA